MIYVVAFEIRFRGTRQIISREYTHDATADDSSRERRLLPMTIASLLRDFYVRLYIVRTPCHADADIDFASRFA